MGSCGRRLRCGSRLSEAILGACCFWWVLIRQPEAGFSVGGGSWKLPPLFLCLRLFFFACASLLLLGPCSFCFASFFVFQSLGRLIFV
jgi:hypothetical protein